MVWCNPAEIIIKHYFSHETGCHYCHLNRIMSEWFIYFFGDALSRNKISHSSSSVLTHTKYANMDTTVTTTCQHWPVIMGAGHRRWRLLWFLGGTSLSECHTMWPVYKHYCLTRETARPLHTLHSQQSVSATSFQQIWDNTQFSKLPCWQNVGTTHRDNMACDNLHVWNVESLEVTEGSSHWGDANIRGGSGGIPGTLAVGMCLMLEF